MGWDGVHVGDEGRNGGRSTASRVRMGTTSQVEFGDLRNVGIRTAASFDY